MRPYGLQRVCIHWDVPRSTYYSKKKNITRKKCEYKKRGPKAKLCDQEVLEMLKKDIATTPFKGEGHKKIHARLKKQGVAISRNRVLKLMKQNKLLSPHRRRYVPRKKHDGKIITTAPNIMWCSDGTKIFTVDDGWVWVFIVEEHWNAGVLDGMSVKKEIVLPL